MAQELQLPPNATLTRLHGCEIVSVIHPEGEQWQENTIVCDGYVHKLLRQGQEISDFLTLAEAIQAARRLNS